jgi:DnaJ-domain-containing protein 1
VLNLPIKRLFLEVPLEHSSVTLPARESYGTAAVLPWDAPDSDLPLVAQLEHALGEDFVPDASFFVESWTSGVPVAAESLLRRREAQQDRIDHASIRDFSIPTPRFSSEEFVRQHQQVFDMHNPTSPSPAQGARTQRTYPRGSGESPRNLECESNEERAHQQARSLLGVDRNSSRHQIKTAYRQLVRLNHPDRLVGASAQTRQIATEKMISLNEAYHLLCSVGPA